MSRQDVFWVFLTAVGLVLAFPPFPTGFVASVALVPFFFYLRDKGLGAAFRGGYAVGMLWAGGTLYWIGWATAVGLVGILLYLPLYFAVFSVLQTWLLKRWGEVSFWAAPFVWTGLEVLASSGVLGFPWNLLGHTQTYTPAFIQYASVTGVYGVSFWVVLLNVLFLFLLLRGRENRKRTLGWILAVFLLWILPWGHGRWILSRPAGLTTGLRVALVQGNIDPYKKWTSSFIDSNFAVYRRLTWQVDRYRPDLVVWPETATPCYLRNRLSYLRQVKSQIDSMGVPLLTGSPDYDWVEEGEVKTYNGALLIRPNSWQIDRYHKMHLVPFSERVPFVGAFPFLYDLAKNMDLDIGSFSPGDSVVVFEFVPSSMQKKVRFSAVICFESVFPHLVREFVKKGAQFLVVITNDGWFGKTSGPYQHAQVAVFRAIENRVWVARCANTGISGFVDPFGRVRSRTAIYEEAVAAHSIGLTQGRTFFLNHGSFVTASILMVNGIIFGLTLIRRRRNP